MMRYFEVHFESVLGAGVAFQEFEGEVPVRQVELYDDQWYASRLEPDGAARECPSLEELGLGPDQEVTAGEFDWVWALATRDGRAAAYAA